MADDIVLNTMSGGDTCAADDIGGKKYQRIKLIHGAADTNDGDVATTNGLPVRGVLNTINFGGLAAGALPQILDNATAAGFGNTVDVTDTSFLILRSEFDDSSDSVTLECWYKDAHATTTWSVGEEFTLSSTTVASGSAPSSAACLEGAGWFFGRISEPIDCRGWTSITLRVVAAPVTAGVSVWGDPV